MSIKFLTKVHPWKKIIQDEDGNRYTFIKFSTVIFVFKKIIRIGSGGKSQDTREKHCCWDEETCRKNKRPNLIHAINNTKTETMMMFLVFELVLFFLKAINEKKINQLIPRHRANKGESQSPCGFWVIQYCFMESSVTILVFELLQHVLTPPRPISTACWQDVARTWAWFPQDPSPDLPIVPQSVPTPQPRRISGSTSRVTSSHITVTRDTWHPG